MPVFNWEKLKNEKYTWWIDRLRRNTELFDIVRLDHFRAFSAFWEVPAGAPNAISGVWQPGPGADFFHAVKKSLGELSFVAEDLGEIDEPVYQLRDQFHLPGMKVLQFAFDGSISTSLHIPHNYERNFIVYTGTHDNNTTRGWFTKEAGEQARLVLEQYAGRPVSGAEVSMILTRMAYSSVAATAILPMQDVLNLDESARMNTPASMKNNWAWQLVPGQLSDIAEENLRRWTGLYNRE
jgi:4-alpha-glucanotransferase